MRPLPLTLLLIFMFILISLSLSLLFVLYYRRRFHQQTLSQTPLQTPPHTNTLPTPTKELLLYYLCLTNTDHRNPSRVGPTSGLAVGPLTVDQEMEKFREMYASRFLYTIKEEKEGDEEKGSCDEKERFEFEGLEKEKEELEEEEEEEEFESAVSSPVYLTPASSPPRPEMCSGRVTVSV